MRHRIRLLRINVLSSTLSLNKTVLPKIVFFVSCCDVNRQTPEVGFYGIDCLYSTTFDPKALATSCLL